MFKVLGIISQVRNREHSINKYPLNKNQDSANELPALSTYINLEQLYGLNLDQGKALTHRLMRSF